MSAKSEYILGIETATKTCSAAVTNGLKTEAEYTINLEGSHQQHLMPMIEQMLCEINLELHEISAIAVSTGPGSFTGLRIGIASAKGLSLSLKKPIIGISTLEGMALNIPAQDTIICPVIDARKGEIYSALYRNKTLESGECTMEKLTGYLVMPLEELLKKVNEKTIFTGEIMPFRDKIKMVLGSKAVFAPSPLNIPRASNIAFLGYIKKAAGIETGTSKIQPLYVRRPDAVSNWKQKEQLNITLTEMQERDIRQVMEIEKASFTDPWREDMFRNRGSESYFITARQGEKVLGYACGLFLQDEFHLGNIAVHKDFRARGIGRKLLSGIIHFSHSKNSKQVTLEVRAGNILARNFYQGAGFKITGIHKKYYKDTNEDAVKMSIMFLN